MFYSSVLHQYDIKGECYYNLQTLCGSKFDLWCLKFKKEKESSFLKEFCLVLVQRGFCIISFK